MAQVGFFAYGWANPVLGYVMSGLGCLLAVMLTAKARGRRGRARIRLVAYASVALGGIGIYQSHLVALLGFVVPATVVRYEPLHLLASLLLALATVGAGLAVIVYRPPTRANLVAAGLLVALGLAVTQYASMDALRVGGLIDHEPVRLAGLLGVALIAGCGIVWLIATVDGVRPAVLAAAGMGVVLCGAHYLGMSTLVVHLGPQWSVTGVTGGLSTMVLVTPVILIGAAVTVMLWFFTVGTCTATDLDRFFTAPERTIEIERWMIDEVTTRIAMGYAPPRSLPVSKPQPRVTAGSVTAGSVTAEWRTISVWGADTGVNTGARERGTPAVRFPKTPPPPLPPRYPPTYSGSKNPA